MTTYNRRSDMRRIVWEIIIPNPVNLTYSTWGQPRPSFYRVLPSVPEPVNWQISAPSYRQQEIGDGHKFFLILLTFHLTNIMMQQNTLYMFCLIWPKLLSRNLNVMDFKGFDITDDVNRQHTFEPINGNKLYLKILQFKWVQ